MDFFISQITGKQIPYEPATAAELRQLGLPEQLRNNQSTAVVEQAQNEKSISETQQSQQTTTSQINPNDNIIGEVDYEPIITVDFSPNTQIETPLGNATTTVSETESAISLQDVTYLAQLIAAHPALAQAASAIAKKHAASKGELNTNQDLDSDTPDLIPLEPIQESDFASDANAEEMPNKEVIDAYTHAKQIPSHTPRVVTLVSEIMTSPVSTLPENSSIDTVWKFLQEKRFHHVPIVSTENKLVGVISDRDFIALGAINHRGSIRDLITTNIITTRPSTDVRSAAKLMFDERIGALPVVDENENLVGILTRSDILRVLYQRAPLELWL